MKQKGTHEQCVPFFHAARFLGGRIPRGVDGIARKPPEGVGPRPHAQRTIVVTAIVEMEPHRQHLLQERRRRLGVVDGILDRPGGPSLDITFLCDGD